MVILLIAVGEFMFDTFLFCWTVLLIVAEILGLLVSDFDCFIVT